MQSAIEVGRRFEVERAHIARYTKAVSRAWNISSQRLEEANDALESAGFERLPTFTVDGSGEVPTEENIEALVEAIRRTVIDVSHEIREIKRNNPGMSARDYSSHVPDEFHTLFSEWVDYFKENELDESVEDAEDLVDQIFKVKTREGDTELGSDDVPSEEVEKAIVRTALLYALDDKDRAEVDELEGLKALLHDLKLSARMQTPSAEIHIYRQSMILLMTAFDAAIFDVVRIVLQKRFFHLISLFSRSEKLQVEKALRFSSYLDFRDRMIEATLRKVYARELIHSLAEAQFPFPDDQRKALVELILRRNIHVHNRGIVDQKYFDEGGAVARLNLGDVARVDKRYLAAANDVCRRYISDLVTWATSLRDESHP